MSMDLLIRFAGPDDAAVVGVLFGQLGYPIAEQEMAARLERFMALGQEALVADVGGEVVAVTALSVMHTLHRPAPVGRMSSLVVSEAVRGRGIGKALVAAAEKRLAERGCGLVEVTSNMRRPEAHGFYEGLGYERTSYRFFKTLERKADEPAPSTTA
jgi:ribosomal protein S18 acetylase RimI-like enzyme